MPKITLAVAAAGWAAAAGATVVARSKHRRYRGMLDHAVRVARERDDLREQIAAAVAGGRIPIPPAVARQLAVAGRQET